LVWGDSRPRCPPNMGLHGDPDGLVPRPCDGHEYFFHVDKVGVVIDEYQVKYGVCPDPLDSPDLLKLPSNSR